MPDLSSHHSPVLAPFPRPTTTTGLYLPDWSDNHPSTPSLPDNLLSPAFTPPATPGISTPSRHGEPRSTPVDTTLEPPTSKHPRLIERLPQVECVVRACIPTTSGTEMFLYLYQNSIDTKEHLAIVFGNHIRSRSLDAERPGETEMDRMIRGAYVGRLRPGRISSRLDDRPPAPQQPPSSSPLHLPPQTPTSKPVYPLIRVHSECYTGETAWSARCDCGEQLDEAARLISHAPTGGAIIYLRQEGRGIGLSEKLKAYNLQDLGNDTVEANLLLRHPADARSYGLATAMLVDLGLGTEHDGAGGVRLLTNNPDKVRAVEGPNREVRVRERVAMVPLSWRTKGERGVQGKELEAYLRTKIGRMGHVIGPDG